MASSMTFTLTFNDKNMYNRKPDKKAALEKVCMEAGLGLKRVGTKFDTIKIYNGPHTSKTDKRKHITFRLYNKRNHIGSAHMLSSDEMDDVDIRTLTLTTTVLKKGRAHQSDPVKVLNNLKVRK